MRIKDIPKNLYTIIFPLLRTAKLVEVVEEKKVVEEKREVAAEKEEKEVAPDHEHITTRKLLEEYEIELFDEEREEKDIKITAGDVKPVPVEIIYATELKHKPSITISDVEKILLDPKMEQKQKWGIISSMLGLKGVSLFCLIMDAVRRKRALDRFMEKLKADTEREKKEAEAEISKIKVRKHDIEEKFVSTVERLKQETNKELSQLDALEEELQKKRIVSQMVQTLTHVEKKKEEQRIFSILASLVPGEKLKKIPIVCEDVPAILKEREEAEKQAKEVKNEIPT